MVFGAWFGFQAGGFFGALLGGFLGMLVPFIFVRA